MSVVLTCGVCGIGFQGRSDALYCSSVCRQKAHRGRTARRIAGLIEQHSKVRAGRAIVKPDVAATIQRAHDEQRRARELCRTAAETVRRSQASQRLSASRQPRLVDTPAPAPLRSGRAAADPTPGGCE